jgi:O-antigen ligase
MASLLAVELMLLAIGLTYSRGGLIAVVVAVGVSIAFGGARLRTVILLGAAAVAAAVPLWVALTNYSLSAQNIPLAQREIPGGQFAIVLLVSLVLLFAGGRKLLDIDQRIKLTPDRARALRRLVLAGAGVGLLVILIGVTLSSRGLGGTISHAWQSFSVPRGANVNNPNVSFSSGYRWVWWKEAVGAWSARPFGGWGAGSFPVLDLMYRTTNAHVQDAHSVPLQWLAETGLVGGLLAVGAYALLLAAGVDAVRRRAGTERAFAAALLAGAVAYAVHSFYDWDWEIPGVTFPVLVFLGVLAGSAAGRWLRRVPERPAVTRGIALAIYTFAICVYAISALLPSIAATNASAALTQAGGSSSRAALRSAEGTALFASRLDPLSDEGLKAAASISVYLRQPVQARAYLLQAVRRNPTDELAWEQLAALELGLRDARATRQAAVRVLQLDPRGPIGRQLTLDLEELITPPSDSATATSTPLPG